MLSLLHQILRTANYIQGPLLFTVIGHFVESVRKKSILIALQLNVIVKLAFIASTSQ